MADFSVLLICTGNQCRSPMAEYILRARLDNLNVASDDDSFYVSSAGLVDVGGAPMHPDAIAGLADMGIAAVGSHVARKVTAEDVERANLVLGMTREHRGAAISLWPPASVRAFTMLEFGRLCAEVETRSLPAGTPVERAHASVGAARLRRGLNPPADLAEDDLPDPLGMPSSAFSVTAKRLVGALDPFLALLVSVEHDGAEESSHGTVAGEFIG